ncbi:MAG: sugar transferase, partial [Bacteroidales bacterium]
RTMYAYSEYIQPYIYKQLGLAKGGKISDDYRVSPLGKFLRKTWLDELPTLINWIKGDMKFVGVRPLSSHYFNLYSKELQELRTKVKPGLFPPFYADMPETLEEIQESEIRYIKSYLERPFYTDCRYFFKTFANIVFKGRRSK